MSSSELMISKILSAEDLCLVSLSRATLLSTSALVLYSLVLLPLSLQFQICCRVAAVSQTMGSSSSSSGLLKSNLKIFSGVAELS